MVGQSKKVQLNIKRRMPSFNDIKLYVIRIVRQYENDIMKRSDPRIQIFFVRDMPDDVLCEMVPYYDAVSRKPVRVELRFNAPLLVQNSTKLNSMGLKGLIRHEICHGRHFCAMVDDYLDQKNPHADDDVFEPCMLNGGKKFHQYRFGRHPDFDPLDGSVPRAYGIPARSITMHTKSMMKAKNSYIKSRKYRHKAYVGKNIK